MKALKNFAVAFIVSAVIFGIAAVIVMNSLDDVLLGTFAKKGDELSEILNSAEEKGGETVLPSENLLTPINGDTFTVLLICTDYRPDVYDDYLPKMTSHEEKEDSESKETEVGFLTREFRTPGAKSICIMKCSKETGEFIFAPVPSNAFVLTPSGYETLHDVYTVYGVDFFKSKIEAITGVEIDHYASINCNELNTLVSTVGAVWCNVPCEIFSNGTEFVSATAATAANVKKPKIKYERYLEVCTDYIGPSSIGLLLFKDYSNGVDDELIISDSYARGVTANFAKLPTDSLPSIWNTVSGFLEATDIKPEFFEKNGALFAAYSEEISRTVNFVGNFKPASDPDDATFEIDYPRTVEAFVSMR